MRSEYFKKIGIILVVQYGYLGLVAGLVVEFLGFPFPGEIVLSFTGFLIFQGHLKFWYAALAAIIGSVIGSSMAYYIGRHYGRDYIIKYGKYIMLSEKKIAAGEKWFMKYHGALLLFGRFAPGVRPMSAYIAGMAGMKFPSFLVFSISGAAIWCVFFITLGRIVGRNWSAIIVMFGRYNLSVFVLVLGIAGFLLYRWNRRKRD